jgi:hypothetical protein
MAFRAKSEERVLGTEWIEAIRLKPFADVMVEVNAVNASIGSQIRFGT